MIIEILSRDFDAEQIIEEANFPKELVINYWEDQIVEIGRASCRERV